jgi:hypothetical protein
MSDPLTPPTGRVAARPKRARRHVASPTYQRRKPSRASVWSAWFVIGLIGLSALVLLYYASRLSQSREGCIAVHELRL